METAPNELEAAPLYGLMVAEAAAVDEDVREAAVPVADALFVDEVQVAELSVPFFHSFHASEDEGSA